MNNVTHPASYETENPYAPRTLEIIGRMKEKKTIHNAIRGKEKIVILLTGGSGIGKTRLQEDIPSFLNDEEMQTVRWSGVIDLSNSRFHSPERIRDELVKRLDPHTVFFGPYQRKMTRYEKRQREGTGGTELDRLRRDLEQTFLTNYNRMSRKVRLVLSFDTLEATLYTADLIEQILKIESEKSALRDWLAQYLPCLRNTVVILAGRSEAELERLFSEHFTAEGWRIERLVLEKFTQDDALAYIQALQNDYPGMGLNAWDAETRERLFAHSQGLPIRLSLLIDLIRDEVISSSFLDQPVEQAQKWIDQQLFEKNLPLPGHISDMVYFLLHARKGLTRELLRHLTQGEWTEAEVTQAMEKMRTYMFVKSNQEDPNSADFALTLHDDFYDRYDRMMKDKGIGPGFESYVLYYENQRKGLLTDPRVQQMNQYWLYYLLQFNYTTGYQQYKRLMDEAIRRHLRGYELSLHEEYQRFRKRFTEKESPYCSRRACGVLDDGEIERTAAVHLIERLKEQGQPNEAFALAERLRNLTESLFNWDQCGDVLYQSRLLAAWGHASVYSGHIERARALLDEAIQLLTAFEHANGDQFFWKHRNLGVAYNFRGYLNRITGENNRVINDYSNALSLLEAAGVDFILGQVKINMAYWSALQGQFGAADWHINDAFEIFTNLDIPYYRTMAQNVKGAILSLEDRPISGALECEQAMKEFERQEEYRGMGMATINYGFSKRKHADSWKRDLLMYPKEKAGGLFREAQGALEDAREIFSPGEGQRKVQDPIRYWEATNELGSLYTDWGWLLNTDGKYQEAEKKYQLSIQYLEEALDFAIRRKLQFQIADTLDDLAQAYGDRSFLYKRTGDIQRASEDRKKAEEYQDEAQVIAQTVLQPADSEDDGNSDQPGPLVWLINGKTHMWRGVWLSRDLETGETLSAQEKDALKEQATQSFLKATLAFQHYGGNFQIQRNLNYFIGFIKRAGVGRKLLRKRLEETERSTGEDLVALKNTLNNLMGY